MRGRPARILYLHHAAVLGGSSMSLLYTVQGLDRSRVIPVVGLVYPSDELVRLFAQADCEVVPAERISLFQHTTVEWWRAYDPLAVRALVRALARSAETRRAILDLVRTTRADLVHLNSVVLVMAAFALANADVPFVWHVRESPARGHLGLRTALIRRLLQRCGQSVIFISEADRFGWVRAQSGTVLYNYVDFTRFDRTRTGHTLLRQLSIPEGSPVVTYLGGLQQIKGIVPLIEALALVRSRHPEVICLMPGALAAPPPDTLVRVARAVLPLIGSGTLTQRVEARISRLGLAPALRRTPFMPDVSEAIAAGDVLVFPALQDHFARPVIEAGAMARPVVASDLPSTRELIDPGENGVLVSPGSVDALASALSSLLDDPSRRALLGERGWERARRRYDAATQIQRLMRLYDDVLSGPRSHAA